MQIVDGPAYLALTCSALIGTGEQGTAKDIDLPWNVKPEEYLNVLSKVSRLRGR